jgi:hypothetical protein
MAAEAKLTTFGCEHLKEWAEGKLNGLFLLGTEAATAASACHELLEQSRRRNGPIWRLREPDDKTWFRFYRSRRYLRRGLCEALGLQPDEARIVDTIFARLTWYSSADKMVVCRSIGEDLKGIDLDTLWRTIVECWQDIVRSMNALELLDDRQTQSNILRHPAMVFFLQVAAPIYLRHGEWPQTLLMRATASKDPDLVALHWLVRSDRRARRHPAIRRAIDEASPKVAKAYRLRIAKAENGCPREVKRSTLETRLCGLISEVSIRLGSPLEAREIRKLFDRQAQHETGILKNLHLHHYSRTFTREVYRARMHWLRSLPTLQAYESLKSVRTLLDRAFYHFGHDTARTLPKK